MRYFILILFSCLILFLPILYIYGQEEKTITGDTQKNTLKVQEPLSSIDQSDHNKTNSNNANFDALMLYGKYNSIFTSLGISQNFDFFTYNFNSDLKRSNDYGYINTSFNEGEIGFKGDANFTDRWKFTPQFEVKNESHGMYHDNHYSREEKDKIVVKFLNEYKPIPTMWTFDVGGAQYVHRLVSADVVDAGTSDARRSEFYKFNAEAGWEYISDASNEIRFKSKYANYFYSPTGVENDTYSYNELVFGFKIIEYFKLELGGILNWNRDLERKIGSLPKGVFPSGRVHLSTTGFKYTSLAASYSYDLVPFKPEDFNFEYKYMQPSYELPPGKVHKADFEAAVKVKRNSKASFFAESFEVKGKGTYEKNNNFYNYYSLEPDNVLSARAIEAKFYKARGDAYIDLRIFRNKLRFGVNYEYTYYMADENIYYRPSYIAGNDIKLIYRRLEIEWENSYRGEVYTSNESNDKLNDVLLGSLKLQVRMLDSFHLYGRIDNLYNAKYNYRENYPEPGITWAGGLKIVI